MGPDRPEVPEQQMTLGIFATPDTTPQGEKETLMAMNVFVLNNHLVFNVPDNRLRPVLAELAIASAPRLLRDPAPAAPAPPQPAASEPEDPAAPKASAAAQQPATDEQ